MASGGARRDAAGDRAPTGLARLVPTSALWLTDRRLRRAHDPPAGSPEPPFGFGRALPWRRFSPRRGAALAYGVLGAERGFPFLPFAFALQGSVRAMDQQADSLGPQPDFTLLSGASPQSAPSLGNRAPHRG